MADYNLEGQKWETANTVVTWSIATTNYPDRNQQFSSFLPASFEPDLQAAFAKWSSVANITFVEVPDSDNSDIRFGYNYIDGPDQVVGETFYSYDGNSAFISADIEFDTAENWHVVNGHEETADGFTLYQIALHEIGHAIGMAHYTDGPAIMNPVVDVSDLTQSDIDGARALYGPPIEAPLILAHNALNGGLVVASVANGSASYAVAGGYGNEWSYAGVGDFGETGSQQLMLHNTSGAIDLVSFVNGQASYAQVGGVGNEWSFDASGNFDGAAGDDLLIENTSGNVEVASLSGGQLSYTSISSLGSQWTFGGQRASSGALLDPKGVTGDLLGDGHTDFLIHNSTTGAIDIGEDVNNLARYTQVGNVGNEWQFVGAGDFIGQGKTDLLMHNATNGSLYLADIQNGVASYTALGGYGQEWQAVGSGKYLNDGRAGLLLHNTNNGALDVAEVLGGHAVFTQIGGLGSEWTVIG